MELLSLLVSSESEEASAKALRGRAQSVVELFGGEVTRRNEEFGVYLSTH